MSQAGLDICPLASQRPDELEGIEGSWSVGRARYLFSDDGKQIYSITDKYVYVPIYNAERKQSLSYSRGLAEHIFTPPSLMDLNIWFFIAVDIVSNKYDISNV